MQKILSNKIVLIAVVGFLAISFFFISFIFVHADDTDAVTHEIEPTSDEASDSEPATPNNNTDKRSRVDKLKDSLKERKTNYDSNKTEKKDLLNDKKDDRRDSLNDKKVELKVNQEERVNARQDKKVEMEGKREEKKLEREEKKRELHDKKKDRIHAHLERILHRFRAAIGRLEKMADRVDSRILKFEEDKGVDLSEASALVDETRRHLEAAKSALSSILSEAETALGAEDPKTAFERVREILHEAKESIKSAHKNLVEAIRLVKASI
jgi:DNA repair exonuclease SbcCD ATPase subunit